MSEIPPAVNDVLTSPVVYEVQYWLDALERNVARMALEGQHHNDMATIAASCVACRERLERIKVMCDLSQSVL